MDRQSLLTPVPSALSEKGDAERPEAASEADRPLSGAAWSGNSGADGRLPGASLLGASWSGASTTGSAPSENPEAAPSDAALLSAPFAESAQTEAGLGGLSSPPGPALLPGQRLARGVARALRSLDFVSLEEMIPAPGLRVDLMALGPKGELWVIECKSGRADYAADRKWQGYLAFCDRFFWAVDADFPTALLPEGTGLILADAYDAEIIRLGPETPLAGARRKALTLKFSRQAAARLQGLRDPRV